MYQRALQGKEKVWGPDHTSTLDTVNNLGNLYVNQGKLDEADRDGRFGGDDGSMVESNPPYHIGHRRRKQRKLDGDNQPSTLQGRWI
jgi:hypothetical protein